MISDEFNEPWKDTYHLFSLNPHSPQFQQSAVAGAATHLYLGMFI
jgi:hypothetical protein